MIKRFLSRKSRNDAPRTRPRSTAASTTSSTLSSTLSSILAGNFLEYFDFTIFGLFAMTIGRQCFPLADSGWSLMMAVATLSIGYLLRPFGALAFGIWADRKGRRQAFSVSLTLMALGTLIIGLTPPYAMAGALSPIMLISGRIIQGLSQSGEVGAALTALTELDDPAAPHAAQRRGWRAGLALTSASSAVLFGAAVATLLINLLSDEAFSLWGWRLPFLVGACIAPLAIVIRRRCFFDNALPEQSKRTVLADMLRQRKTIVFAVLIALGGTVPYNLLAFYLPNHLVHHLNLSLRESSWISVCVGATLAIASPIVGNWSDRIQSRRRPMLIGQSVLAVGLIPGFVVLERFPSIGTAIVIAIALAAAKATGTAVWSCALSEMFPRRLRATSVGLVCALASMLFGGTTQLVVLALTRWSGSTLAPAFYGCACVCISILVLLRLPETGHQPLRP